MGKFHKFFTELSAHDTTMAGYYSLTFLLCFCYDVQTQVLCISVFTILMLNSTYSVSGVILSAFREEEVL